MPTKEIRQLPCARSSSSKPEILKNSDSVSSTSSPAIYGGMYGRELRQGAAATRVRSMQTRLSGSPKRGGIPRDRAPCSR